MINPYKTLAVFMVVLLITAGCQNKAQKPIIEQIQSVPVNSGFRMEGYWVWGGSVIKVDSLYHMFASRWKKIGEFPSDYFEHSEIVRATSKSLVGPYEFREVIIGERDSSFWDSNMAHNPTIHKIGDEYVLFYNASDFTTEGGGIYPYLRRVGYAVAPGIEGPWLRSDEPLIAGESNNPAVYVEGEKIRLLYRNEELRVLLATAGHYSGPYQVVNDNVWPDAKMEDFYLFKMGGKYHFICEDNIGAVSGHERWGVHFCSGDGINDWGIYKDRIAYDHDILFEDGSVLHCTRRERPQLVIEDGILTGLCTAVYTGTDSWCQPVPLSPGFQLNRFSCSRQPTATVILMSGKIITMDDDSNIAEAVAIKDDKIIETGTNDKMSRYAGEHTEIIDLAGKTVIPGIIDGHSHTINASLSELEGVIPDIHSIEELLDWIQAEAASKKEGEWIIFSKIFFTRLLDMRPPTLAELDKAAPVNPVFLNASYGGMINSAAMKSSGISRTTNNEGLIKDEESGELTGFIRASAFKLLNRPSPVKLSSPEKEEALKVLLKEYNKCGITGIISGLGGWKHLELYRNLHRRGELPVRISQNFRVPSHTRGSKEGLLDALKTLNTHTGKGDEWVRSGSLKIFLDGGILTGTAFLREPWGTTAQDVFGFNDPSYRGGINYSHEDLVAIISAANESGWSFTAHCTGGGGVDRLLDAFEEVNEIHSVKDKRNSIIHGNFYTREAIERMNHLGILANAQPAWFYKDADAMKYILGEERVKVFNPFRSLTEGEVLVCAGSDHMVKTDPNTSVNPYNPFLGMWSMITRTTERGNVVVPSEAISREEALKMYTVNNAYATFEEDIKGSLEPGKLADLVVLSDDILSCSEDRIRDIHSELTMVGGKVVYSNTDESSGQYEADVIIYGGTSAAITAAVEIIQSGKTVIVVSPDEPMGGLASEGVGFTDYGKKEALGGLSREFYHHIWKHYNEEEAWKWQKKSEYGNIGQGTPAIDGENRTMWIFEPHAAEQVFEDFVEEYKIPVHRGEFLNRETGVAKSKGSVLSITTLSGKTFTGKVFMDATYEGDLMAAAGISYHVGRESRDTYNELWNGVQTGVLHHKHWFETRISPYNIPGDSLSGVLPRISVEDPGEYRAGDEKIQAYCYRVCMTRDERNRVPFPEPENYDAAQYELLLRVFNSGWDEWFEKFDPIPNKKTDTNNNWPRQLYVREARRMLGEYITTEHDVLVKREVPKPVGMGSYTVDSHNIQRYITPEGYVQNEGDIGVRPPSPYSISYGSMVPQKSECENLLVPVCVSSSHIAFGSIRMEPVYMILGQSAAVAAAIAIDHECAVQDIEYATLESALLEKGQVLRLENLIE